MDNTNDFSRITDGEYLANLRKRDWNSKPNKKSNPCKFDGLQFFTFTLQTLSTTDNAWFVSNTLPWHGVVAFRGDDLVAFTYGAISEGQARFDLVILRNSRIRKITSLERVLWPRPVLVTERPKASIKLIRLIVRGLREHKNVLFTNEGTRSLAQLCGFIPEFDEIYK